MMVTDVGVVMSLLQCTHVVYYASNAPGGTVQINRRCERNTGRVFMNLCILCESEEVNDHSLRCREDLGGYFTRDGMAFTASPPT